MITILDGILTIPESERFVGFTGDNLHTQKTFMVCGNTHTGWLYRLYLTFDDGRCNYFLLPSEVTPEGTKLIWDVAEGHIFKSGLVKAQIKAFSQDSEVYHTTSDIFVAGFSTEEEEAFKNGNSEFLQYERTLNELYEKMLKASAKMPYVGKDGFWYKYDINEEAYVNSGVLSTISIEDGTISPEKFDRDYLRVLTPQRLTSGTLHHYLVSNAVEENEMFVKIFCFISTGDGILSKVGAGRCLGFYISAEKFWFVNLNCNKFFIADFDSEQVVDIRDVSVADGSVTEDKLSKSYWEKKVGSEIIETIEGLFETVGYVNDGGTLVNINANLEYGDQYIYGNCIAYGWRTTDTLGTIYVFNATEGTSWTVTKLVDGGYMVANNLDRIYWKKDFTTKAITSPEQFFKEIGTLEEGGSIAVAEVNIKEGELTHYNIIGQCLVFGRTVEDTKKEMYLINLSDGVSYKVTRTDVNGIIVWSADRELVTSEKIGKGQIVTEKIADKAVTEEKLSKSYWEKSAKVSDQITSMDGLFEKIGLVNSGGTIQAVNINVNTGGYIINGFGLAFGISFSSGDTIYFINTTDGTFWKINRTNGNYEVIRNSSEGFTLTDECITSQFIKDGAVFDNKLSDGAVTTSKLSDDAVTNAKIARYAVTEEKIQQHAVTDSRIAEAAVTNSKIQDGAVTQSKLYEGSVTPDKLDRAYREVLNLGEVNSTTSLADILDSWDSFGSTPDLNKSAIFITGTSGNFAAALGSAGVNLTCLVLPVSASAGEYLLYAVNKNRTFTIKSIYTVVEGQSVRDLQITKVGIVDTFLSETSTNPVQNNVVTNAINSLESKLSGVEDFLASY